MMMMERTSEILESKIKTTASSVAFPARFSVAAAGPTKESSMPAGGRAKFHVTGPRRLAIGAARLANGHAEIRRRAIGPTCLLSYAARARGGAASPLVSSLGTGHDVCRPERNVPILLLEPGERARFERGPLVRSVAVVECMGSRNRSPWIPIRSLRTTRQDTGFTRFIVD